ncbi:hypothetical protein PAPYR_632 [Paratrimastix pyriformis]|uniref:TRAF-type domain-containing protein n=1 Tax=Paratrimastix pyriformis TaxID=342808 RepID=A0ABQ8UVN3_9EUKA|nr:hypothetical protein PAPYR_632 [Paratrimastix pyriformis]
MFADSASRKITFAQLKRAVKFLNLNCLLSIFIPKRIISCSPFGKGLHASRLVARLRVRCLRYESGCSAIVNLPSLQHHLDHECEWRLLPCVQCGEEVLASQLKSHQTQTCPQRLAPCSAHCGAQIPLADMEAHMATACPNRLPSERAQATPTTSDGGISPAPSPFLEVRPAGLTSRGDSGVMVEIHLAELTAKMQMADAAMQAQMEHDRAKIGSLEEAVQSIVAAANAKIAALQAAVQHQVDALAARVSTLEKLTTQISGRQAHVEQLVESGQVSPALSGSTTSRTTPSPSVQAMCPPVPPPPLQLSGPGESPRTPPPTSLVSPLIMPCPAAAVSGPAPLPFFAPPSSPATARVACDRLIADLTRLADTQAASCEEISAWCQAVCILKAPPTLEIFSRPDVAPVLVRLLQHPAVAATPVRVPDLFRAVVHLSGTCGKTKSALGRCDVAPVLVELLGHPSMGLATAALGHLIMACAGLCFNHPANQRAFGEADVAPALVSILGRCYSEGNPGTAARVSMALAVIFNGGADNLGSLERTDVARVMTTVLGSPMTLSHPTVALYGLMCLRNITYNRPEAQAAFDRANIAQVMARILEAPILAHTSVAEQAFAALAHLSLSEDARLSLRSVNVLATLEHHLTTQLVLAHPSAALFAYWALAHLSDDTGLDPRAAAGIVQLLDDPGVTGNVEVLLFVLWAMTDLAARGPLAQVSFASANAVVALCRMLEHPTVTSSARVLNQALRAVGALAKGCPPVRDAFAHCGIVGLLAQLQTTSLAASGAVREGLEQVRLVVQHPHTQQQPPDSGGSDRQVDREEEAAGKLAGVVKTPPG